MFQICWCRGTAEKGKLFQRNGLLDWTFLPKHIFVVSVEKDDTDMEWMREEKSQLNKLFSEYKRDKKEVGEVSGKQRQVDSCVLISPMTMVRPSLFDNLHGRVESIRIKTRMQR